jgi:hypothetical protein
VKLTAHLRLVPRSRMREAIPHSPNTPSWRGAQLKHRDSFTFTVHYKLLNEFNFCSSNIRTCLPIFAMIAQSV